MTRNEKAEVCSFGLKTDLKGNQKAFSSFDHSTDSPSVRVYSVTKRPELWRLMDRAEIVNGGPK